MNEPRDEISLRELYLILRSGLVGIVLAAVLVGGVAYLYLTSRPHTYQAAATVLVSAPQPTSGGDLANLIPQVGLGTQAYTALANSGSVLRAAFDVQADDPEELTRLSETLSLKAIDTANQTRGQLTLEHSVTAGTADEAARRANDWARASAEAATATMQNTVNAAVAASAKDLEARKATLDAAQAAWTAFAKDDARVALRSQIDQLALQQAATRSRLAELDGLIASNSAQQALLTASVAARGGTRSTSLEDQVEALVEANAVPEAAAGPLLAAISQLPPGVTMSGQDLVTLVSRSRLETLTATLAGDVAERSQLQAATDQAEAEGASLRDRLAELEQRAAEPEAALSAARTAYDRVAAAMPLLGLQQSLVNDAARVIISASPPLRPKPQNKLTVTVAAALVAGLLATLIVFLRAAVADPTPPKGPTRRATEIDQTSGTLTHHDEELLSTSPSAHR